MNVYKLKVNCKNTLKYIKNWCYDSDIGVPKSLFLETRWFVRM